MYAGRGGGSSEDGDDEATSSAAAVMRGGGGGVEGYGGMRSLPRIGLRQSVNGIEDEEDDVEDGQEETGGERRRRRRGDGATGGVEAEESLNSSGDSEGGGGTTRTYVEDEVDRIKKSLMLMQEQIEKNSITGAKVRSRAPNRRDYQPVVCSHSSVWTRILGIRCDKREKDISYRTDIRNCVFPPFLS